MKIIAWFGFVLGAVSVAGKLFSTAPEKKVTLECGATTYKNNLVWRHGNDLIVSVDGKSGFPRRGQGELPKRSRVKQTNLEITGVNENDTGIFTCDADGNVNTHTLLIVSVYAKPSTELKVGSTATLHCEVIGLKEGSTVQWKRPNGKTYTDTVQFNPVTSSDAGDWICEITQDGETITNKLSITVQELTLKTTSSPTQSSKGIQNPACPSCAKNSKVGGDQLSWWVWVAVGVGCLITVLLMVCVIVLCKRIRRNRKRILKMKNSRQPLGRKQYCQCNCPTAAARPQQGRRKGKSLALPV